MADAAAPIADRTDGLNSDTDNNRMAVSSSPTFSGQQAGEPHPRPQKIALINMPWAACDSPSIQCGLLKAILTQRGHSVDTYYLNMHLAADIGGELYTRIVNFHGMHTQLVGEWLFARSAFGPMANDDRYLDALVSDHVSLLDDTITGGKAQLRDALLVFRCEKLPRWIEEWTAKINWNHYDVIGFSSTFEQNVASIALAKAIKVSAPQSVVVFGGANLDGDMGPEYLRAVGWIDYVVVGEGDVAFPLLIETLAVDGPATQIPGVCCRRDGRVITTAPSQVRNLDTVPAPDYSEYFQVLQKLGRHILGGRSITLPYESARGCWWGEKHHCTFCGLNNLGMQFRAKSARRVLSDLEQLTSRYHILDVNFTDNILDMRHIGSLIPLLAQQPWDLRLFYEVKANLTREQLRDLRRAGVVGIQPGIESLSSHILSLMRKGSTLLLNLRLLKWAQYYGMQIHWNILMGFPGETDNDYDKQLQLIPLLHHLPPPGECGDIWLERFSPYFTDSTFPIENIRPVPAYEHIYPTERFKLDEIAYFFSYQPEGVASRSVRERLSKEVQNWKEQWRSKDRPTLDYESGPGWVRVRDTRKDPGSDITIDGWRADVFRYCGETARTPERMAQYLSQISGETVDARAIRDFAEACTDKGLMVTEDGRYFNIALPRTSRGLRLFRRELIESPRELQH